jgi:hypothetical protein
MSNYQFLEGTLNVYVWDIVLEERGCYVESRVPLAECVMYQCGSLRWSEV